MKNFDEKRAERLQRDRAFTIGGQEFTMKASVRPEVLTAFDELQPSSKTLETLAACDEIIVALLDGDDAEARWTALREQNDDPLTLEDITDLVAYLVEQQTGRVPTPPPSRSGSGSAEPTTATGSTGGSF